MIDSTQQINFLQGKIDNLIRTVVFLEKSIDDLKSQVEQSHMRLHGHEDFFDEHSREIKNIKDIINKYNRFDIMEIEDEQ